MVPILAPATIPETLMLKGPADLWRGNQHLGRVAGFLPSKMDGWEQGNLEPSEEFAGVASLFAKEIALLGHADRWPEAWEDSWVEAQGPGVRLICADGQETPVDLRIRDFNVEIRRR